MLILRVLRFKTVNMKLRIDLYNIFKHNWLVIDFSIFLYRLTFLFLTYFSSSYFNNTYLLIINLRKVLYYLVPPPKNFQISQETYLTSKNCKYRMAVSCDKCLINVWVMCALINFEKKITNVLDVICSLLSNDFIPVSFLHLQKYDFPRKIWH